MRLLHDRGTQGAGFARRAYGLAMGISGVHGDTRQVRAGSNRNTIISLRALLLIRTLNGI